jgi:hypothetical protein
MQIINTAGFITNISSNQVVSDSFFNTIDINHTPGRLVKDVIARISPVNIL